MIKKLGAIGLLMLILGAPAAAGAPDDEDLLYKFAIYTRDVYLGDALKNTDPNALSPALAGKIFSPRVLGYSLANLLRYARRGSENHQIWLRLDRRLKQTLFEIIDLQAAQEGWVSVEIEERKQDALKQYIGAQQHWFDDAMVTATGVKPNEAPNFFDTLATVQPAPQPIEQPVPSPIEPPVPQPVVETPPSPPVQPPAPPVHPPNPPPPSPADAVAGTYRVTGKPHYDQNPSASLVRLSGSMDQVETEFKLFDGTQVTWDYKGTATWDGLGTDSIRDLRGTTKWLKYPHIIHELTVRITRGADGVWHAVAINIGGNLFQLAQTQAVERPIPAAAKTLTIKNSTAGRIMVYLDNVEVGLKNDLGTVEPRSERKFSGIPERGRWYLKILPAPDTYPKIHVYELYIKEAESAYVYEVLEWHLR